MNGLDARSRSFLWALHAWDEGCGLSMRGCGNRDIGTGVCIVYLVRSSIKMQRLIHLLTVPMPRRIFKGTDSQP